MRDGEGLLGDESLQEQASELVAMLEMSVAGSVKARRLQQRGSRAVEDEDAGVGLETAAVGIWWCRCRRPFDWDRLLAPGVRFVAV